MRFNTTASRPLIHESGRIVVSHSAKPTSFVQLTVPMNSSCSQTRFGPSVPFMMSLGTCRLSKNLTKKANFLNKPEQVVVTWCLLKRKTKKAGYVM